MEGGVNLVETGKNHNFSNPMYDAMTGTTTETENGSAKDLYEVPIDTSKGAPEYAQSSFSPGNGVDPPKLAVLSPSAIMQRSSPTLQIRQKELSPSSTDTGKDTQKLVEEDNSEC